MSKYPCTSRNQSGQVLVTGIFILIVLLLLVFSGFDVYNSIRSKFKIETAQEAAALAGASWQRDSLNLIGEINLIKACSMLLDGNDNWIYPLPAKSNRPGLLGQLNEITRASVLQSRIDILTEMQSRVSFVGPLIGFAAAQQTAKANGIATIGDFDHYINDLRLSSRYRQEFGGAATYIHNYAWKEPYIGLIETISRNGIAVYPNSTYTTSPSVYPPELQLENLYTTILRKNEEIAAAEGKGVYPQSDWYVLKNFVYFDPWAERFNNPPWWNIEYNKIAFPNESEIFTLGVGTTGSRSLFNENNRQYTVNAANGHLSPDNIASIYDSATGNIPSTRVSLNFFSYDDSWYPSYFREKYEDYDYRHYNYWFKGDVLRKHIKEKYRYEGPAAYVETYADLGKVTAMIQVSGYKHTKNSIRLGSNRPGGVVSDLTEYRPGTIAKTLGALDEKTPPIALPVVLPVFDKVSIMPTYMPIPYNFSVLRDDDSALRRFLAWLSTRDNLDSNDNLPAGCSHYLAALRILVNGPQFRYYGWNPNFNQENFDNQWRNNPTEWHLERVKDPTKYQYTFSGKDRTLPGYAQEPNIFTACPAATRDNAVVKIKDQKNGGFAERHFIGQTGTYIVVDSNSHIVNNMEEDPTWDPSCCGTCYARCNSCSGGGLSIPQLTPAGNSDYGPPRM